jgi:threonine synthase
MAQYSFIKNLVCTSCGTVFSCDQPHTYCPDCVAPLAANYDIPAIKNKVDRDQFISRPKFMWRWTELLPVIDHDNIVTLGEGDTPLLPLKNLGKELGVRYLYMKEEGINPTGSFKARGISCAVSKARERGIKKLVIPSAGNAGGALAAYATRAGMEAIIYMPESSQQSNIIESKITGQSVELVDGLIDLAGKIAENKAAAEGWFNMSTFKEPYRVEGKKIIGYEIAESLGWKLPDVIIYPTGGGIGLVGMWKAFKELMALGWLNSTILPRMIAVQPDGCAPVVEAIKTGAQICHYWDRSNTIATGLCVPKSFADELILKDIRESNGTAISVSDGEISQWQKHIAQVEGIFTCPEGAATLAGLKKLLTQKQIGYDETVIVFNTAMGFKYRY